MSDTEVAEILKLPTAERLRLMELIWESLSQSPTAVPLQDLVMAGSIRNPFIQADIERSRETVYASQSGLWTGTEPTHRLAGKEGGRYEVENAAVESCQPAIMAKSDPQKMSIRHLAVTRKFFRVYEL